MSTYSVLYALTEDDPTILKGVIVSHDEAKTVAVVKKSDMKSYTFSNAEFDGRRLKFPRIPDTTTFGGDILPDMWQYMLDHNLDINENLHELYDEAWSFHHKDSLQKLVRRR